MTLHRLLGGLGEESVVHLEWKRAQLPEASTFYWDGEQQ